MKKKLLLFYFVIANMAYCNILPKVLVTGAAGFIGSHVCEALLERGDEVIIIEHHRSSNYLRNKYGALSRAKFYKVDICDKESLGKIFEAEQPDEVCHLAVRFDNGDAESLCRVNILGTVNLLEMARHFKVKNFLLGSTASVYGISQKPPFSEEMLADKSVTLYGASKRSAEILAYTYHSLYSIPITILRIFTTYGPRAGAEVFRFLDAICHEKPIQFHKSGRQSLNAMRGFTYVSDIVDGIVKALDKSSEFEIFNLGSTEWATNQDVINIIEEVTQKRARIQLIDGGPVPVAVSLPNMVKPQEKLGFECKVTLKDGIKKLYSWYQNEH